MTIPIIDITQAPFHEKAIIALLRPEGVFDMRRSLEGLKVSGALDTLDRLSDDMSELERPILLHDRPFLLRITDMSTSVEEPQIAIVLYADDRGQERPGEAHIKEAAELVNRRFFLDVDMKRVREALDVNEYGEGLCTSFWPARPANLGAPWDGLLKTVISTRIFPGLAKRLQDGLIQSYGSIAYFNGQEYGFFPSPERLASVSPDELTAMKFSRQKADYVPGIAQMIVAEPAKFDFERLRNSPSEEAVAILEELPGVGPWIARYTLMRSLAHQDVFVDEGGIRKTLIAGMGLRGLSSTKELVNLTKVYAPYRTFACYYTYMKMYA